LVISLIDFKFPLVVLIFFASGMTLCK
jgi:hypothetical protein